MSDVRLQWDDRKNRANIAKHGISFEEAASVFFGENAIEYPDEVHSGSEERFLLLGFSAKLRLLVVCYCLRQPRDTVRIISARKATRKERTFYTGEML